nr:AAA family ATPase [Candidatus Freyarchaeota archaeon]
MKVVSFINYKGGVGKSTTAYHIGCALALDQGMNILLVDVDPQTNLTFLCATPERWEDFKKKNGTLESLYRAYLDNKPFDIKNIVWQEPIEKAGMKVVKGLNLIPSDVELLGIDLDLQTKTSPSNDLSSVADHYVKQRTILRDKLNFIRDEYDYILIDCPPNLYLVTQNALAASDCYVVTALPDHLSTIGLSILEKRVRKLNKDLKNAAEIASRDVSTPELGGIIFVRVRLGGTAIINVHDRKMREVSGIYTNKTFDNYTTEGIGYSEAAENALPVFLLGGSNPKRVAYQYREIANEFIRRIPS